MEAPGDWVTVRTVDDAATPPGTGGHLLLLLDRQFRVKTGERFERTVRCLKTVAAVHEAAQWRLDFDPATQHVAIHSIAVRRDGQNVEQADARKMRLLQREENLDRFVVDGRMTIVMLLEDVRVGDVIDFSYTIRTARRLMRENFWAFCVVPTNVPLHAFHLSVRFPTNREPRWKASEEDYSPIFKKYEDECEWQWKLADVKPREVEPGVPGWHIGNPWLQVSDCASWEAVAVGFHAAWAERFDDPELTDLARSIATGAATPAERIDRALTFVQDEIRYVSVTPDLGGQVPAAPGDVLRRRFGDCKDKCCLAAHLLRRLGVPARPVLVNAALRQTVDRLLPMPDAFDHVVVEYEVAGKRRWVDLTAPLQGGGALSRPVPDYRMGLPIGAGVAGLERIASVTSLGDHYELRETFALDTAGRQSTLKVMVRVGGIEADNLRRELTMEGTDAVARKREQFYRQMFPDIRRVGELEWRDDRPKNELLLADLFELRSAVAPGRDAQTSVFEYRSHLIQAILSFSETGTRRQPFAVRYPCELHHWIEIESTALEGGQGQTTTGRDTAFRFACDLNRQYGRMIVHYSLRTLADGVKPERFEQFKGKVREIWPATFLHVELPLGVVMTRRSRVGGSLIPALPPPRDKKGKNSEAPVAPSEQEFTLPAQPAGALVSVGDSATASSATPDEAPAVTAIAPAAPTGGASRAAAAFSDPTSPLVQTGGGKRRRRRVKRGSWMKTVRAVIFVIVGLLLIWLVVVMNLKKG